MKLSSRWQQVLKRIIQSTRECPYFKLHRVSVLFLRWQREQLKKAAECIVRLQDEQQRLTEYVDLSRLK